MRRALALAVILALVLAAGATAQDAPAVSGGIVEGFTVN